jgi:hypothetical protein
MIGIHIPHALFRWGRCRLKLFRNVFVIDVGCAMLLRM